jgi:predicted RNA methylase
VLDEIRPTSDDVLVDFGCGKGRVLLIAAMRGLKRVAGVEFSEELCSIARENIRRLEKKTRLCPVEVVCTDASLYEVQADETIFFFFNPFDSAVMNEVIRNIENSFDHDPRRISIVYINLKAQPISTESGRFRLAKDTELNGLPLQIYELGWELQ